MVLVVKKRTGPSLSLLILFSGERELSRGPLALTKLKASRPPSFSAGLPTKTSSSLLEELHKSTTADLFRRDISKRLLEGAKVLVGMFSGILPRHY